jgi:hypothetical protein
LFFTSAISARSRSLVGIFPGVMAWNGVNGCFGETDRWIHPARAAGGWWDDHGERMKELLHLMKGTPFKPQFQNSVPPHFLREPCNGCRLSCTTAKILTRSASTR